MEAPPVSGQRWARRPQSPIHSTSPSQATRTPACGAAASLALKPASSGIPPPPRRPRRRQRLWDQTGGPSAHTAEGPERSDRGCRAPAGGPELQGPPSATGGLQAPLATRRQPVVGSTHGHGCHRIRGSLARLPAWQSPTREQLSSRHLPCAASSGTALLNVVTPHTAPQWPGPGLRSLGWWHLPGAGSSLLSVHGE